MGLSVLFEELAKRLTLVELDEDVSAVWKTILSIQGEKLASEISDFDLSPELVKTTLSKQPRNLFDRAFQTILKNRIHRGGILAPGAGLMKQGENGRGIASRWYPKTLEGRILAIAAERHRIRFMRGDGIQFIYDNASRPDMVFFIDPPYTIAGRRLYVHSKIDHGELFRIASSLRGHFLMTYDKADPILDLAQKYKFDTQEIPMKSTHHAVMNELLISRDLDWLKDMTRFEFGKDTLFKNL